MCRGYEYKPTNKTDNNNNNNKKIETRAKTSVSAKAKPMNKKPKNRLGPGLAIELSVDRLGTTHENHTQDASDDTEARHNKRRQEVTY